jgi:glyoxylase-like metal-dependent hydrolase (beta-lactamase superfamily II)
MITRVSISGVAVLMSSWLIQAQAPADIPPPIVVPGITKLANHSYVIPDRGVRLVPNVGVIVGSRATLVIDTGMGLANARTVLAEVAKVSQNQTLYLTVTHSHPEHVSGLGAFPEGTIFVVSKPVAAELAVGGNRAFAGVAKLTPAIGEMVKDATLRPPDVVFDTEHRLDLGGVHVRLLFFGPTHSVGDTLTMVEEDGVLYAGDIVLTKRFPSFQAPSRRQVWLDVLDRVAELTPRIVVPGHGEIGDAATIATETRVMNEIHARVAALKREGRSLEETTAIVVAEFRERYPDWRSTVPNEIAPIVRSIYAE